MPSTRLAAAGTAATAAVLVLAGCGSGAPQHHAVATATPTIAPAPVAPPWFAAAAIRGARPARPATAVLFRPNLHLRIPRHWTPQEIDQGAFTVYIGKDEMASPGEITFDGALEHRSVGDAIARLRRAHGIRPAAERTYRVGTVTARGFDTPTVGGSAEFADSGFHTQPGDRLRVLAFRGAGRTITVFVVTGAHAPTAAFRAAAMRVLRTVRAG